MIVYCDINTHKNWSPTDREHSKKKKRPQLYLLYKGKQ